MNNDAIEYVGLIPAAGKATRISPLPCSKEIFPVGFGDIKPNGHPHPKVAAHYLLDKMKLAGARKAYLVLSKGKWDIPAYFGNGSMVAMAIGYLITDLSYGVPFTLDSAFPFLENKRVLFGFPDIILKPNDVYIRLIDRMDASHADIVVGLFLADNPTQMDMVDLQADGTICGIQIKPAQTDLKWTWILAVWNFTFTQFMHDYVLHHLDLIAAANGGAARYDHFEIYLGEVIEEAIHSGLMVDKVMFNKGQYIDIGSPQNLVAAVQHHLP